MKERKLRKDEQHLLVRLQLFLFSSFLIQYNITTPHSHLPLLEVPELGQDKGMKHWLPGQREGKGEWKKVPYIQGTQDGREEAMQSVSGL